ncbi:hypothetical protein MASR2M78_29830 [Treponema sp.]
MEELHSMLNPHVVAHVGASESGLYPAGIFESLLASELELFAVNPNRPTVFGHTSYKSVADLPKVPDLALITVDRRHVGKILTECASAGIRAAVIITSGFAEAGLEGAAFQAELESFAGKLLLLGPNCAGFANIQGRIIATRFAGTIGEAGISFVSQSGALMMALHGSFASRGAGMRYLVSVGNQLDLRVEDLLQYFATDKDTRVSSAFIESVKDGRAFIRALEANRNAGKPVVLVKAGRTEIGSRLAATHTAAAAGEAKVFEAVCAQYGAILVDDIDDLVSTALLFDRFASSSFRNMAWLTQSGGLGSLLGDHATKAGLSLEPFSAELQGELRKCGLVPDYQTIHNPVDLRGDLMRGSALGDSLRPFMESTEVDSVGLLFAKSPWRPIEAETVQAILDARNETGKAIIVVWVGNTDASYLGAGPQPDEKRVSALALLVASGIPVFFQASDASRAIERVRRWAEVRDALL